MTDPASASSQSVLRARRGDHLIIRGHRLSEPDRDGEILEVLGDAGEPPFVVRWEDGHVAELFPGSDAMVQHFQHP
jgi:Domain of unknown function (DUF1918)